jgi:hypothetical protein
MNAISPMHLPATQNEGWGFYGTVARSGLLLPQPAWDAAIIAVRDAAGISEEGARAFLDSRHGRHLADAVLCRIERGAALQAALDATIAEWMAWRIDAATSRQTGIPLGLPYLVGFAFDAHFETF